MTYSGKSSYEELRYGRTITCGMLPTLRELASRGCNNRGSVCLVPFNIEMDAAIHLQMTLLEAYCREIGIEVMSVSKEVIQAHLCPGGTDLSCVLVTKDDPFFLLKLPKWNSKTQSWKNWNLRTELRAVFYRRTVSILGRSALEDKGGRVLFRHTMCPTCLNEAADNGHYIL